MAKPSLGALNSTLARTNENLSNVGVRASGLEGVFPCFPQLSGW